MNRRWLAACLAMAVSATGWADPQPGRAFPAFAVNDLAGQRHTERDLQGRWSVVLAMTDKDAAGAVTAWHQALDGRVPGHARVLYFTALDIFPLVSTSTIVSRARARTPQNRWDVTWLSRDGAFAEQMGLPESETPWAYVVDPAGRVVLAVHAMVSPPQVERVLAAVGGP